MHHYLKHALLAFSMPLLALLVVVAPLWGLCGALALVVYQITLDMGTARELAVPSYRFPWIVDAIPYVHVPASLFCLAMLMWRAAPGDLWGFGHWLDARWGSAVAAQADHGSWPALAAAVFAIGFVLSTNTIAAHELVHRTTNRLAVMVGRWILAIVGDAQYSITHVYVHHPAVGTPEDPSTARRGENLYAFALRSTLGQYRDAWKIETCRLQDRSWFMRLLLNKVISGIAMTALFALGFYVYAGMPGLVAYLMVAATSKLLLEAVEYIQHYGLVRSPGAQIEPRHSWDCTNRAASHIMFNLPRHAHHHIDARASYWALKPSNDAPELPYGYAAHILLAMVPPLWQRFAASRLARWDETMANSAERELAARANRESRHPFYASLKTASAKSGYPHFCGRAVVPMTKHPSH